MMFELRVLDGLRQGAALPLFGEQWSIGAHPEADLVLNDPGVVEQHARLQFICANWLVQAEAGLLRDAEGRVLAQITSLALNTTFSLGGVRLCVTLAEQPWPQQLVAPEAVSPPTPHESAQTMTLSSISHLQQKRLISLVLVVTAILVGVGMISTEEREVQASLIPPVVQKQELASSFEVRQQLLKMLKERELSQRVTLQLINDQVALSGDVSQDEVELVARMLSRFGEQFHSTVPVISRVRVHNRELPFRIVQIVGGPNGHVVLEEGGRLFLGDEVEGLRLVLIENGKVVFEGEQRYEVHW